MLQSFNINIIPKVIGEKVIARGARRPVISLGARRPVISWGACGPVISEGARVPGLYEIIEMKPFFALFKLLPVKFWWSQNLFLLFSLAQDYLRAETSCSCSGAATSPLDCVSFLFVLLYN